VFVGGAVFEAHETLATSSSAAANADHDSENSPSINSVGVGFETGANYTLYFGLVSSPKVARSGESHMPTTGLSEAIWPRAHLVRSDAGSGLGVFDETDWLGK